MIELNLLPDVKKELLRAQVQRNIIISISILVSIAAAIAIGVLAGFAYVAQGLMMNIANKTIDEEFAKLSQVEDLDKMLTVKNQLAAVSELNNNKLVMSRVYDILNAVVPDSPHNFKISSVVVRPVDAEEGLSRSGSEGSPISVILEGQTSGGFASLEVLEKQIAAAVMTYKSKEGFDGASDVPCGDQSRSCTYVAVGGGDRAEAVQVNESSYGEDQGGTKTLYFKLSFTLNPEALSNQVSDVIILVSQDGNVTDSNIGVPRSIFGTKDRKESEDAN